MGNHVEYMYIGGYSRGTLCLRSSLTPAGNVLVASPTVPSGIRNGWPWKLTGIASAQEPQEAYLVKQSRSTPLQPLGARLMTREAPVSM